MDKSASIKVASPVHSTKTDSAKTDTVKTDTAKTDRAETNAKTQVPGENEVAPQACRPWRARSVPRRHTKVDKKVLAGGQAEDPFDWGDLFARQSIDYGKNRTEVLAAPSSRPPIMNLTRLSRLRDDRPAAGWKGVQR